MILVKHHFIGFALLVWKIAYEFVSNSEEIAIECTTTHIIGEIYNGKTYSRYVA